MLASIKAAIRWLRAQATTYGIDPDHIGIDDVVAAGFEPLIAGQQVKVLVGVD